MSTRSSPSSSSIRHTSGSVTPSAPAPTRARAGRAARAADDTLGGVVREIGESLKAVIRSEIHLAKAEAKGAARDVGKHAAFAGAYGIVAALGVLPLLAFVVIGLGRLLGDNYWLSSLLVAAVMIGVGGFLATREAKRIRTRDLTLPRERESLREVAQTIDRKLHDIREAPRREASNHHFEAA